MKKKRMYVLMLCLPMVFTACGKAGQEVSAEAEVMETTLAVTETVEESTEAEPIPETTAEEEVIKPIYADQLENGSYLITVDSSSSMFRVVKCELIVENGTMQAVMTMSGDGYGMVYMGTGEEALLDTEENYVPFVLDEEGAKTFTVSVEALDMELDCAAWSIRKEKWYDRTLIFQSDELPADALIVE